MFFYKETGFYEREKEEQVVLPFHDPSHQQEFQAFLGRYALDSFFAALISA